MIQHQGIWLPDGETHLTEWMTKAGEIVDGKGTYQIKKLRAAIAYCKQFRNAIDVGAHCGMWSMQLIKRFQRVYAFEPVVVHQQCYWRNLEGFEDRVTLFPEALGENDGFVNIHTAPTSSGDSWVDGTGNIPMHRLDSYDISDVDFIKLDCEGYELFALRGGVETIIRCKPVIIVEQKPGRAVKYGLPETGAVPFLQDFGYRLAQELNGDFIMVP